MSHLIENAIGPCLESLLDEVKTVVGEDDNLEIQAVVLAGAVKVNDHWIDFGMRADSQGPLKEVVNFVNKGDDASFANTLSNSINAYTTAVTNALVEKNEKQSTDGQ